jgi:LacI family transcriptional regulator
MPQYWNTKTPHITILDVAAKAGVSYGTVSRVLNNNPNVNEKTRQHVLAVIEELGYEVNRQARGLVNGRSGLIGILVQDMGTSYIGEIIRGIDVELEMAKYDLVVYTTHRENAKEAGYVANLTQGKVDGLLLILPRNPVDYMGVLQKRRFPFVLIDHQGIDDKGPSVAATNWQGAYTAVEYLINLGHKRIGFITGVLDLKCSQDRLEGYRSALKTHHLPLEDELVVNGDFFQSSGVTAAKVLLELPQPPTAIFASNDVMAMGVMDIARHMGKRVPEDISVIGFDDIPQASMVYPALTTVRQPLEQMGRVATQMLLEFLNNPEKEAHRIELPTQLIIRDSCTTPIV